MENNHTIAFVLWGVALLEVGTLPLLIRSAKGPTQQLIVIIAVLSGCIITSAIGAAFWWGFL